MLTEFIQTSTHPDPTPLPLPIPPPPPAPQRNSISTNKRLPEDGVFFRAFYRNLALLQLGVLLILACVGLLQNIQTTLTENGENLISAHPRISAHFQGPNILISVQGG